MRCGSIYSVICRGCNFTEVFSDLLNVTQDNTSYQYTLVLIVNLLFFIKRCPSKWAAFFVSVNHGVTPCSACLDGVSNIDCYIYLSQLCDRLVTRCANFIYITSGQPKRCCQICGITHINNTLQNKVSIRRLLS